MQPLLLTPIALSLLLAGLVHAEETAPALRTDPALNLTPSRNDEPGAWYLQADQVEGNPATKINAAGKVELRRRGELIFGDKLCYQADPEQIEADGHARVEQYGDVVWGDKMLLKRADSTGFVDNARYQFALGARGNALKLLMEGDKKYRLKDATFTTCAPGQDDWLFRTSDLDLDYTRNVGSATHNTLRFMGVPVIYWPWMDFSLNGQRKSGFLAPSFGTTSKGGAELMLPFYWNIAPNYDMEIAPRYITRRGLALNGEFRYLRETFSGELKQEYLANDKLTDSTRSATIYQHRQRFGDSLYGELNLQRVSDDQYFTDLSNKISSTSQVILPREGLLAYNRPDWNMLARVQRYQTLQDPAAPVLPPYARLPQLQLNAQQLNRWGADWLWASEYTRFDHPTLTTGQRLVANPSVSLPLNTTYAFLKPKLGLHYTRYEIDSQGTQAAYQRTRTLPTFSTDAGVVLERDGSWFGSSYVQTLEPRLFYVRIPYRDQSDLPNFDSAEMDFNFAQMFSENQFAGSDRINEANQLTAAVTTRFIDAGSGIERMRFALGQRFYKNPQRVTLNSAPRASNSSDIIALAGGQLTQALNLDATWQYNTSDNRTQRVYADARYQPEPGKALNLGYRLSRDLLKQVDASAQWPISSRWWGVGRVSYSLKDKKTLETIAGLEYNAGCWVFRIVGQRFVTTANENNSGLFLQIELSEVARVGSNPLELLSRSISGYTHITAKPQPLASDAYQ
ncbi:LPS-assembly protein LptD [Chitinivorax sp. PXF-14]|uniref:LPS-assembly protein LptD n=1 Tax=Chitinivorax sp. PXF-14 TaxID=3230488 RepID=UPI0034674437